MIDFLFFLNFICLIFITLFFVVVLNAGFSFLLHSVFQVFFFLLPGYIQYKMNVFPWKGSSPPAIDEYLLLFVIFMLYNFFFFISYYLVNKNKMCPSVNLFVGKKQIMACFVAVLPAIFLINYVGFESFFQGRGTVATSVYGSESTAVIMFYTLIKFVCVSIFVFVMLSLLKKIYQPSKKYLLIFLLLLLFFLNVILNGPTSSPRFHFMAVIISILLALGFFNSKRNNILFFFGAPFFLFFVFPFIKTLGEKDVGYGISKFDLSSYLSQGVDFDAFQQMFNIMRYVHDEGYSFGLNFLGGIAFFIPRLIWHSKPEHLGYLSSYHAGYEYNNLSAPLLGEFYYAFGFIGVILGAVFFGYIVKKVDIYLRSDNVKYLGLSVIFSSFLFISLRGAFGSVFPAVSVSLFFYFFLVFISKLRVK